MKMEFSKWMLVGSLFLAVHTVTATVTTWEATQNISTLASDNTIYKVNGPNYAGVANAYIQFDTGSMYSDLSNITSATFSIYLPFLDSNQQSAFSVSIHTLANGENGWSEATSTVGAVFAPTTGSLSTSLMVNGAPEGSDQFYTFDVLSLIKESGAGMQDGILSIQISAESDIVYRFENRTGDDPVALDPSFGPQLTITDVPEPSSVALLAMASVGALFFARRRLAR